MLDVYTGMWGSNVYVYRLMCTRIMHYVYTTTHMHYVHGQMHYVYTTMDWMCITRMTNIRNYTLYKCTLYTYTVQMYTIMQCRLSGESSSNVMSTCNVMWQNYSQIHWIARDWNVSVVSLHNLSGIVQGGSDV